MAETLAANDAQSQRWNVVFNSGGGGNHNSLRTPNAALKNAFGAENATTITSILWGDLPTLDRFPKIATIYRGNIRKKPTVVVAHSMGGPEAVKGLAILNDEGFFADKNNSANTKLVLMSTTGYFKTPLGGIKYMGNYGRVLVQEVGVLGRTVPGKTSVLQGIVSLNVLPPKGIERQELIEGVRKAASKLSHHSDKYTQVDGLPDRDYSQYLGDTTDAVTALDTELVSLIKQDKLTSKQRRRARGLIRQRGRLTKQTIEDAFANTHADDFGDPIIPVPEEIPSKEEAHNVRKEFLIETFLKAKTRKRIKELKKSGVEIYIADPENDAMLSRRYVRRQARRLLGKNYADHFIQIPFATHNGPYAVQPQILVELAKEVIRKTEGNSANPPQNK